MTRTPKRPRDPAQLAKQIVDIATGTEQDRLQVDKNAAAVELGRRGGLKGGSARAANLTADERRAISRHAAETRWSGKGRDDS